MSKHAKAKDGASLAIKDAKPRYLNEQGSPATTEGESGRGRPRRHRDDNPRGERDDDSETRQSHGAFVDLRINGRLFPTSVVSKFRKFKLPEIMRDPDEDPCQELPRDRKLRKYQAFVAEYLDYRSPHKSILLYHGLGSGKTATAINVYNVLYNYTPAWNVFILIKAALHDDPWIKDLNAWLRKDDAKEMWKNIIFVHYDSPFADRDFLEAIRNSDSSKQSMYIIDEAHNFIRNVYSNINSGSGRRAQTIYDYIIQDKKDNDATRVLALSGTPTINVPFELALMFNMLRPGTFPRSENEFNQLFVTSANWSVLDPARKNQFQRRILGLCSYYIGTTPDTHATSNINPVDVPMTKYQEEVYRHFEEIETRVVRRAGGGGGGSNKMYRSYTRQACNFVFPDIDHRVTGMKRPRPNKFRLSEREALKILEGKEEDVKLKAEKNGEKFMNVSLYLETLQLYIKSTEEMFQRLADQDATRGHTLQDDVKTYIEKYKGKFKKFHAEAPKSALYDALYNSSPKMITIIFTIMKSPGPTVVYSNYVKMEGIDIFKVYLKFFGFNLWEEGMTGKLTYGEYHGGRERVDRETFKRAYNHVDNKYGANMKILLFSPAGTEGVSLTNVRQVHIMEPYWNEVRITQMIGRAIRQCSHKDLPMKERHVEIYRYKMTRSSGKQSTDQHIEDLARSKDNLVQSFLEAVREAAIDCELYKAHNMMHNEYKCFKFDEPSLFDKHAGPAYKPDIYDDMKIDNGSNSTRSITTRIKALKIMAVKKLSDDKYTKPQPFWFYPETRVVYDYESKYPVGKVGLDEQGSAMKLDKDTYVIDHTIPFVEI
jgi:superfamily II DNA or RNA helicase